MLMVILGIAAVVVPIVTFLWGEHSGAQREKARAQSDLVSKVADEYADMHRRHYANGPHALSMMGLDLLGRDELIREAIRQMAVRTGTDPWGGREADVKAIDLVAFFRYVRQNGIRIGNMDMIPDIVAKSGAKPSVNR